MKGENLSTFMEVRKLDPGLGIGGMENKRIGRYLPRVGSPIVYVESLCNPGSDPEEGVCAWRSRRLMLMGHTMDSSEVR